MHLKACCPDSTRLDNDIAPPTVKSYHNHQENNHNQQSNKQQIQDN